MLLDVACTYLHHLAPIAKVMEGGATPLMVAARLGRSSVAPWQIWQILTAHRERNERCKRQVTKCTERHARCLKCTEDELSSWGKGFITVWCWCLQQTAQSWAQELEPWRGNACVETCSSYVYISSVIAVWKVVMPPCQKASTVCTLGFWSSRIVWLFSNW